MCCTLYSVLACVYIVTTTRCEGFSSFLLRPVVCWGPPWRVGMAPRCFDIRQQPDDDDDDPLFLTTKPATKVSE